MKLSTRARYGTRALLELALCWGEGPVPLKEIAQRQEISESYLAHLITPLIAAGMAKGIRGPRGGISLIKPPHEIKLSEVVRVLEGPIAPAECVDRPNVCPRAEFCAAYDVWAEMKRAIDEVLQSTTLQDLVERQRQKEQHGAAMYQI